MDYSMADILASLVIYSALIAVELLFSYCVDISKRAHRKLETKFFGFLVILIPCLFAAMRADTVGTDVRVYAKPIFQSVSRTGSVIVTSGIYSMEIGYVFIAYICSKLSSSISLLLFATELLIICPVYAVACKRSNKSPVWFTMMVFMLFFYCATFNIMRQSIAAAMLLLAYQYYEEKRIRPAILFVIIATLFHYSTPIGVAMYMAAVIMGKIGKKSVQRSLLLFAVIPILMIIMNWQVIMQTLIDIGIFPEKFSIYVRRFSSAEYSKNSLFIITRGNYLELAFRLTFLLLVFVFGLGANEGKELGIYRCEIFISEVLYALCFIFFHTSYGLRLVWFGEWMLLLLLPGLSFMNRESINKKPKMMTTNFFVFSAMLILFFGLGYVGVGWHGIKPLRFRI